MLPPDKKQEFGTAAASGFEASRLFIGDPGFEGTRTFWGIDPQQGTTSVRQSRAIVDARVPLLLARYGSVLASKPAGAVIATPKVFSFS